MATPAVETLNNDKMYVTGALSTFVYTLTGSAVYDALTVPAGYSIIGINANFGKTVGDTALAGTENIVVDPANKLVKIYAVDEQVLTGTYTLHVAAFGKKVGGI